MQVALMMYLLRSSHAQWDIFEYLAACLNDTQSKPAVDEENRTGNAWASWRGDIAQARSPALWAPSYMSAAMAAGLRCRSTARELYEAEERTISLLIPT